MKHDMRTLVAILSLVTLFSCEFSKAVSKDLITGLTTKGDGISCENVYLSDGKAKINRSSFMYGEKVYVNFEDIQGFNKEGSSVSPGLELTIISQDVDTVMHNDDLYAGNPDGFDISPLLIQANVTVASPIRSNNKYTMYIDIWDKKGEGTYSAEMDFDVVGNDFIKIENSNISYNEIYLFSKERMITITGDQTNLDENIHMIFEGLEGFKIEDEKIYAGLSIKAKDAEDKMILNEADLIGDMGIESSEFQKQIAPNFIFTGTNIKNPISCEITVWDKKSENRIKASIDLSIE